MAKTLLQTVDVVVTLNLQDLLKVNRKEAELRHLQAQAKGTETRMRYSLSDLEQTKKKHLTNRHMVRIH